VSVTVGELRRVWSALRAAGVAFALGCVLLALGTATLDEDDAWQTPTLAVAALLMIAACVAGGMTVGAGRRAVTHGADADDVRLGRTLGWLVILLGVVGALTAVFSVVAASAGTGVALAVLVGIALVVVLVLTAGGGF